MIHNLELPALDGRDPLGFLAALGLLRLLTKEASEGVRLSFSKETAVATLHGHYQTYQEVTDVLGAVLRQIPKDGFLPDVAAAFPLPAGTGADPMRVDPRERYGWLCQESARVGGPQALPWLAVLVTDLARDEKGRAALTPFSAPFGKMNVRTLIDNPTSMVRRMPDHLREALTGWRRTAGFIGEFFDHRTWRNPADDPVGRSVAFGVPGATWLAIMALPLFRLGGDGRDITATLWHQERKQPPLMVWPLWRQPLDLASVLAIIEHPAVAIERRDGAVHVTKKNWAALRALGVFVVGAAHRMGVDDRGYARPLTPVQVEAPEVGS